MAYADAVGTKRARSPEKKAGEYLASLPSAKRERKEFIKIQPRGPGLRGGITEDSLWIAIDKAILDNKDDANAYVTGLLKNLTSRIPEHHNKNAHALLDWAVKNKHSNVIKTLLTIGIANKEEQNFLHYATASENLDSINALLAAGADIDAIDEQGQTPLHYATIDGHLDSVHTLLAGGADLTIADSEGNTAIDYARGSGNIDVLNALLYASAYQAVVDNDPDTLNDILDEIKVTLKPFQNDWPFLHHAASNGYLDVLNILIAAGADVDTTDSEGWTALHYAAENGDLDVAMALLEADANPMISDGSEVYWTPIDCAAENKHFDVLWAIAFEAALNDNLDTVEDILKLGQLKSIPDHMQNNWTLLHYAAENELLDIAKRLLTMGANTAAKDNHGCTALHRAVYSCVLNHSDTAVISLLLSAGTDPNARDLSDSTPLHYAAEAGNSDIVTILLIAGANPNVKDSFGCTPLHYAAEAGNAAAVTALLAAGADPNAADNEGEKPSDYVEKEHHSILSLLLPPLPLPHPTSSSALTFLPNADPTTMQVAAIAEPTVTGNL